MAKQGFKRNSKAIGEILKGSHDILRPYAQQILDEVNDPEAFLDEYTTDRAVVGVVVPADKQARDGLGTRAANRAAGHA